MNRRLGILVSLLVMILTVTACEKELLNPQQFMYTSYYEIKQGRYIDYKVTEITHNEDATIKHDTSNYFLRCIIGDTFIDNSGRVAYEYIRMKRFSETEPWVQCDLWSTIAESNRAELIEENQRIVKLFFPVSKYTEWNANMYNTDTKMNCTYKNIHKPKSYNGLSFDSTLVVNQDSSRNLIQYKRKYEVYANHLGLIKKYYKDLAISSFDTLNISSGKEIFMEIINFGE